jgi:hypothetical protein
VNEGSARDGLDGKVRGESAIHKYRFDILNKDQEIRYLFHR